MTLHTMPGQRPHGKGRYTKRRMCSCASTSMASCVPQGKGKGKGKKGKAVSEEETTATTTEGDEKVEQFRPLRCLDVFAGCGGEAHNNHVLLWLTALLVL